MVIALQPFVRQRSAQAHAVSLVAQMQLGGREHDKQPRVVLLHEHAGQNSEWAQAASTRCPRRRHEAAFCDNAAKSSALLNSDSLRNLEILEAVDEATCAQVIAFPFKALPKTEFRMEPEQERLCVVPSQHEEDFAGQTLRQFL